MATRSPRPIPPAPSILIQALTLATLLVPGAVRGQDSGIGSGLFLPFDVSQGALTNVDGVTPYVASVRLQAALGLGEGGPVRIGPVVAVRFANPDWALAGGIRAQWLPVRFGLGGRRWGVGVLAEQLWDTADGRPVSVGLVADLELVRIHGGLVHDWSDERTGFELGAGTDIRSLWAVLFPADDEPPFPDVP